MSQPQLHILKVEVAHGSDRHEISIYKPDLPTVYDLMEELEKKTRVLKSAQQLIYKGQKLHLTPNAALSKFGIFNGGRVLLVGEKLEPIQDAIMRRILGVGKDITLIEKSLNEIQKEFGLIEKGHLDRTMGDEYIPQIHTRGCQIKKDLEAFSRVIAELNVPHDSEVRDRQAELLDRIHKDIDAADKLLNAVTSYSNH